MVGFNGAIRVKTCRRCSLMEIGALNRVQRFNSTLRPLRVDDAVDSTAYRCVFFRAWFCPFCGCLISRWLLRRP